MSEKLAYIWGLMSRFGPQAIYLLTTIILARYVTPTDFGTIGILSAIFTVANILIDSGLGGSLVKENKINSIDCSTIFVFNIVIGVIIYFVLYLLSGYIEDYFAIDNLSLVVKLISIVFPITAIGVVPVSLLKKQLQFKKICISSFLGTSLASIISILIAVNGGGIYSLIVYQIAVNAFMVLCNYIFSKYKISFHFSFLSLKKLLPFGFYTSIVTVIDTIYENLITLLTGKFLNVQTAGYLYQAKRLEEAMSTSLAVSVGTVAFPILTKLKENRKDFIDECLNTFNTITFLSFPILIAVAINSKLIVLLLLGKQWISSSEYLRVLTFAGLFIIMEQLLLSFIKAYGMVKKLMFATIFKRIVGITILLSCIFISSQILVYAYLITTIIGFIINVILVSQLVNLKIKNIISIFFLNGFPLACIFLLGWTMEFYNINEGLVIFFTFCSLAFYYLKFSCRRNVNVVGFIKKIHK